MQETYRVKVMAWILLVRDYRSLDSITSSPLEDADLYLKDAPKFFRAFQGLLSHTPLHWSGVLISYNAVVFQLPAHCSINNLIGHVHSSRYVCKCFDQQSRPHNTGKGSSQLWNELEL
ncbi:hypothetical protein K7432_011912 [Basidiobolus ranarum]|uniref:Uncharacterized protein n=1 Tax=Basidiobolus ranarum TaxID=34480 RepID=A0ABR2VT87_9FUNG